MFFITVISFYPVNVFFGFSCLIGDCYFLGFHIGIGWLVGWLVSGAAGADLISNSKNKGSTYTGSSPYRTIRGEKGTFFCSGRGLGAPAVAWKRDPPPQKIRGQPRPAPLAICIDGMDTHFYVVAAWIRNPSGEGVGGAVPRACICIY